MIQLAQPNARKFHIPQSVQLLYGPQLLPNTIFPNSWSTSFDWRMSPHILSWSDIMSLQDRMMRLSLNQYLHAHYRWMTAST